MTEAVLFVGLGNPTSKYEKTRHNAGFWFMDELAKREAVAFGYEGRFKGMLARVSQGGRKILLLKPLTYMNESGYSVGALARYYKIEPNKVLVAHDDLDFDPGSIRLKRNGGDGGHNGIRDIAACLGSSQFLRLRIGIGRPSDREQCVRYVLEQPNRTEVAAILSVLNCAAECFPLIISGDLDGAMNRLHCLA